MSIELIAAKAHAATQLEEANRLRREVRELRRRLARALRNARLKPMLAAIEYNISPRKLENWVLKAERREIRARHLEGRQK